VQVAGYALTFLFLSVHKAEQILAAVRDFAEKLHRVDISRRLLSKNERLVATTRTVIATQASQRK
jgi:hypothetical protein